MTKRNTFDSTPAPAEPAYVPGEESLLMFEAAKQAIESSRQLLNDVARQTYRPGNRSE